MREEEAKTKWCPERAKDLTMTMINFAVLTRGNQETYKTALLSLGEGQSKCKGSACMMWKATDKEGAPCRFDEETDFQDAGYCGLTR